MIIRSSETFLYSLSNTKFIAFTLSIDFHQVIVSIKWKVIYQLICILIYITLNGRKLSPWGI